MDLNIERLLAEAVTKHGIRLDPDDPAVVVVTLHRLVLEEAARAVTADIRSAIVEFDQAANRVQTRLGDAVAKGLKAGMKSSGPVDQQGRALWLSFGFGAATAIFLIGAAVGRWVLR